MTMYLFQGWNSRGDVNHIHYHFSDGNDSESVVSGMAPDGEKTELSDIPVAFSEKIVLNKAPYYMHSKSDTEKKR